MSTCTSGNDYDGKLGTRISSIFVILIGSLLGAWFPVFAARHKGFGIPQWAYFIAKYFGSGVIVATAFIHLLAPANEAFGDECLEGVVPEYPWPEGIALMALFLLFLVELLTMRYAKFDEPMPDLGGHHAHQNSDNAVKPSGSSAVAPSSSNGTPDPEKGGHMAQSHSITDSYAAQLTSVFILEFGIIFHSVFVGLTLAVSGDEFETLYVVLVFHQTFEGLALGSRMGSMEWPASKRWTPYILAVGYAISTPIAIAIGLGVRQSFEPGSYTALVTNGVFDSISAGILIYTGLVELMAHDFVFNSAMQRAPVSHMLMAFGVMTLGAGLMALLGYWA